MSIQLPLHHEYLKLINPETDRVRKVSDVERGNPVKMRENDLLEARSVIQLYLSGLELGIKSLLKGDLEKFDAVIGDHNCHLTATVALKAFRDRELFNEAENLLEVIKEKKGKINLKTAHSKPPHKLMEEFGFPISVSEKMKYLICTAILRSGTECTENRNGTMTLRVFPNLLQQRLSKTCSLELLSRLIRPLREYVNQVSVAIVQSIAKIVLNQQGYESLLHPKVGKTVRDETFFFPCAFYNMKASLDSLDKDVHFAVVKYDSKRKLAHPPLVFAPQLIALDQLGPKTPMFVIQAFFNDRLTPSEVGDAINKYGITKFLLASIAVNPQFLDMEETSFANNEDIKDLPENCQKEIIFLREEGRKLRINSEDPEICRVVHTYADTYQNLTKGFK